MVHRVCGLVFPAKVHGQSRQSLVVRVLMSCVHALTPFQSGYGKHAIPTRRSRVDLNGLKRIGVRSNIIGAGLAGICGAMMRFRELNGINLPNSLATRKGSWSEIR